MAPKASPPVLVLAPEEHPLTDVFPLLQEAGYSVRLAHRPAQVLEMLQQEPPAALVVAYPLPQHGNARFVEELKADNLYGHLPLMLIFEEVDDLEQIDWHQLPADDFEVLPFDGDCFAARLHLCVARTQRDMHANPLTGLPGNITIMREAERRLRTGDAFALGYLDIDHFKPFNDKYGFSRGDEVLRMTARILLNACASLRASDTYVGHVGGDDFIFMVPSSLAEVAARDVIRNFDLIVPNFYDEDDRRAGRIQSQDRQGNDQQFPMMSCSIAIVDTTELNVTHLGDLSARAAEVKKFAKGLPGSNFLVDRRTAR